MASDKELTDPYYSSSSCHRVIIAAHLKSIPLTLSFPNLKDEQQREENRSALNPIASVPTLVVTSARGRETIIRQSVAILDEPEQRALLRDFVNVITNDVQPPANSRVAQRVKAIRGKLDDQVAFVKSVFQDGLGAYEALLMETRETRPAGFTVGSRVTMADVCLIPAVHQASFCKFELEFAPKLMEYMILRSRRGLFRPQTGEINQILLKNIGTNQPRS